MEKCTYCDEIFEPEDERGMIGKHPYHRECHIRSIVGCVAHQQMRCSCFGGRRHDDPNLTIRQNAQAAAAYFCRIRRAPGRRNTIKPGTKKMFNCSRCGKPTTQICTFPLRGKLDGNLCGIAICPQHRAKNADGLIVCLAHQHFQFPASRGFTLEELRSLVKVLLDGDGRRSEFKAGMVMLAPMIEGCEFSPESIHRFLGGYIGQTQMYIENLRANGIWTESDGWNCKWGEFFAGNDPDDLDVIDLSIAFLLDCLTAAGELERTMENGDFFYKKK